jgi:hypothetical protein
MRRIPFLVVFLLCAAAALQAESPWTFKGTVIKMKMAQCVVAGFRASMSGMPASAASCPQYTVMSDKVVYVVVGRRSEAFIPLAENMDFVIRKNEIVIFSNDEKSTSRFVIEQMTLRDDWEREQKEQQIMEKALERSVSYEVPDSPRVAMLAAK